MKITKIFVLYFQLNSLRGKYILEVPPVESSGLNHVLAISRGSSTWDSKVVFFNAYVFCTDILK